MGYIPADGAALKVISNLYSSADGEGPANDPAR
jgi:hypothetical protein